MTAKGDIREACKRSGVRPASVIYAISQLVLTQLEPFFDEDGAAIPEARDDFTVGYVTQMAQLVLARRYVASGASKEDPRIVAKLVLEGLFGQRDREGVLQLWLDLERGPTQGSCAGQRCAERDMGRLALDEAPMGLRTHIHQKLIEGGGQ
jgi:hypothetical protein